MGIIIGAFNMAIVQSINVYQFRDAFAKMGREDQFSYDALQGLYEYLEQYSEDTGQAFELDVIELCCDFTEMSFSAVAQDYNIDVSGCEDEDEVREVVLDYLRDNTSVVWNDDETVLFQAF
jgi:hypothetical protein